MELVRINSSRLTCLVMARGPTVLLAIVFLMTVSVACTGTRAAPRSETAVADPITEPTLAEGSIDGATWILETIDGQPPIAGTHLTLLDSLPTRSTPLSRSSSPPPHPDGLSGCRQLNTYSSTTEEIRYISWCMTELAAATKKECADSGTSDQQLTCAKSFLADVKSYTIRETMVPCLAITNTDDQSDCRETAWAEAADHTQTFRDTWPNILDAVHVDADVKARFNATNQCISGAGKGPLEDKPVPWQQIDPEKVKHIARATDAAELDAQLSRAKVIHQCSITQGLYAAQETAWIAELQRLFLDDPDSVQPLFEEGIKDILEADGIAPFLTIHPDPSM